MMVARSFATAALVAAWALAFCLIRWPARDDHVAVTAGVGALFAVAATGAAVAAIWGW